MFFWIIEYILLGTKFHCNLSRNFVPGNSVTHNSVSVEGIPWHGILQKMEFRATEYSKIKILRDRIPWNMELRGMESHGNGSPNNRIPSHGTTEFCQNSDEKNSDII